MDLASGLGGTIGRPVVNVIKFFFSSSLTVSTSRRHDIQHNEIQRNDIHRDETQHNEIQLNDTQHNGSVLKLSVVYA